MTDLRVLHKGGKSHLCRELQAATNRRLRARDLDSFTCNEHGVLDADTLNAVRKAAWALGALSTTYEDIVSFGRVTVGVQRMIRNPGRRTSGQQTIAKARLSQLKHQRAERAKELAKQSHGLDKFTTVALQCVLNYNRRPGDYHYYAGGIANLMCLSPSPWTYRSDCSQFASGVQNQAGLPVLARAGALWVSTYTMAEFLEETDSPAPGDFGMYGSRWAPHHVETYCALPGHEFIGHGTRPIDSLTPGRPSFYLRNPARK